MKDNNKKSIKILSIILVTVSLIIAIPIGSFVYMMDYKVTNIASYTSKNNAYKVYFQEIGSRAFFGPSTVKVKVVDEASRLIIEEFRTLISNDGGALSPSNCLVEWGNSMVTITLSGDEQHDNVNIVPLPN